MARMNLRTLVMARSLCMVVLPLWFMIYHSTLPSAFLWLLLWGITMWIKQKLDRGIQAQTDECAQALWDRLTRHVENLTYGLAVCLILFLCQVARSPLPGDMVLLAAQLLSWGLFGIYLYRGIAFCFLDRRSTLC